jgi:hypothetical protein
MQMSHRAKVERAQKSLEVSREELQELEAKLTGKQQELSEAIVNSEVGAGQRARRDRLRKEVTGLEEKISDVQQSIGALESALPGLKKEAELEDVAEREVPDYLEARDRYLELLAAVPELEKMKAALSVMTNYVNMLNETKETFLSRAKTLNAFLVEEGLHKVGEVSIDGLRQDQGAVNREPLSIMIEELVGIRETIEGIEDGLSDVMGSARITITDPPVPDMTEFCECGLHTRVCTAGRDWKLFEIVDGGIDVDTGKRRTDTFELARGTTKPEWPCHKTKPVRKQRHVGEPGVLGEPGIDSISTKEASHG